MEKHDDEKGEVLSRDEMKHTKGGLKISEGNIHELKNRELLIDDGDDDAKGVKPHLMDEFNKKR